MAKPEKRVKRQKKRIERKVAKKVTDRQIKKAGLKPRTGVSKSLAKKGFTNRGDKLKELIVRNQRKTKLEAKKKITKKKKRNHG